jgi:hypothetical protein
MIPAESQRDLCADVYDTERDFLIDALGETLISSPATAQKLIKSFRESDFMQMGSVIDDVLRDYLIGSKWLVNELTEIQEQESFYDGDQ